ncbi:MAG: CAP domain-containing protein [Actinophytocola sp.]|nr:CAP domain-containing protein [Actinophytocola sp.]
MANAQESPTADQGRINLAVENPANPDGAGDLTRPDNQVGSDSPEEQSDPAADEPSESDESPASDDAPEPPSSSETTSPPSASPSDPPSTPENPEANQIEQVVDLANANRAEAGCVPLRIDARLTEAAQDHSSDMSVRDYFDHTTPEGLTFAERIVTAGYPTPGAENIARGQQNASQVMKSWMESDGHRANILNCQLTAIGVGLNTEGMFWTQDFGY